MPILQEEASSSALKEEPSSGVVAASTAGASLAKEVGALAVVADVFEGGVVVAVGRCRRHRRRKRGRCRRRRLGRMQASSLARCISRRTFVVAGEIIARELGGGGGGGGGWRPGSALA